ncbi:cytochrome c [Alteromonas sp. LMIT006]|jgi:cytochrome c556|uniref:c-type cytochrome n=1 Tax=Alteromonadaceae TaxID=72275 RepID=UPI0020CA7E15|nr:cytochrome c [Alteromonas sp. LMIT006]UTP72253.1 cytochrome c [Alteromonas sp. LMIT006]
MLKSVTLITASTILLASFSTSAALSDKQAKNAVEFRKSIFQLVKSNVGPFGAMAKGQMPIDEALIEKNATRLHQLSLMLPDYFVADTRNNDVQTSALDKIWDNQGDFNQKAQNMTTKSKELLDAVQNKKSDEYVGKMRAIFGTCKACHDDYKAD